MTINREAIREFFLRRHFLRTHGEFFHPVLTEEEWEIIRDRKPQNLILKSRWVWLGGFVAGYERAK